MNRNWGKPIKNHKGAYALFCCTLLILIFFSESITAQELTREEKKEKRKAKKQEKIDSGKLMVTPLAGPAYTPELGFTIAGGIMTSFKTNRSDSLIQRSSVPIMLGVSSTGAYFVQTKWTTFWLQDKLRIYSDLNFKNMPDNYWGVGYDKGRYTPKSDTTTKYVRTWVQFNPKILWQFRKNFFVGPIINLNYTKGNDACAGVLADPYYSEYNDKPFNSGLGAVFQLDSRDVPVNAWKGAYVEIAATFFGSYLGGQNNYQVYEFDLRKYFQIKRPGMTLAIQLKGRADENNVPYGEMSQPGTPFDLRGYTWGRYRHESMLIALAEYRHTFLKKNDQVSPHGVVFWLGAGTLGDNVTDFNHWLPNIGIGYRLQVQPRMNLRIDIGFGTESWGFYFNFNEAF
jgi:outer membrane protein assembly factor BamA